MVLESVISMSPTALHQYRMSPLSISTTVLLIHPSSGANLTAAAMQEIRPHLKLPCPPPFSTAAMSALLDVLPADTSSTTTTASYKKPAHRRDTSDELDVFEAASYYSGVDDTSFRISGILPYSYRSMNEERRTAHGGGGMRRSVDAPISRAAPPLPPQSHKTSSEMKPAKEKETTTTKQPISPGGRLASFLNAFFHQGSSKKKSKSISATSSSTTQQYGYSCKDGDHLLESPRGRRKRRSSISSTHSRSSTVGRSSEPSFFSSSGSGFRTPTLVFPRGNAKEDRQAPRPAAGAAATVHASHEEIRSCGYGDLPWGRSRRASTNGILEKGSGCSYYGADKSAVCGGGVAEKKWVLNEDSRGVACRDLVRGGADGPLAKERSLWRSREEDGGESDSSSDLFELPNCDLQVHHFASGLPVYETTSMAETIKRGSSSSMASVAL